MNFSILQVILLLVLVAPIHKNTPQRSRGLLKKKPNTMTLVSNLTQTVQLRDQDPNHQRATDIIFYSCSPKIHLYCSLHVKSRMWWFILSRPKIWIAIKKFELIVAAFYQWSSTIIKCWTPEAIIIDYKVAFNQIKEFRVFKSMMFGLN